MSNSTSQFIVFVTPRAGDAAGSLPATLSTLTGRSRSQLAIELQRGEVELLRSADRAEVESMVARAAGEGLLALVREVEQPAAAAEPEGWGRVLGAFDSKVASVPVRHAGTERPAQRPEATWEPPPLRLGEQPAASFEPRPSLNDTDLSAPYREERQSPVELPGLRGAGAPRPRRAAPSGAAQPPRRLPVRGVLVLVTLALLIAVGFAVQRKLGLTLRTGAALPPEAAQEEGSSPSPVGGEMATPKHAPEQVRRLVEQARDACRSGEFERCKRLADDALNLDETNRAAQAVHIRAVTELSARAGQRPTTTQEDTSP